MQSVDLILPYPPSVNHYWRHTSRGTFLTARAKRYRVDVILAVKSQASKLVSLSGAVSVSIIAHAPDRRRRDLDNLLKATLDAMDHAGVYGDDSQIRKLALEWGEPCDGGELQVDVSPIFN